MSATLIPVVGTGPIRAVALHGFSQTGGMWREVAIAADIGIVAPDLPGHGSAWPGDTSWDAAVASATAVMGTPARVLMGYSQGARVALGAALAMPDSVSHLVLISGRSGIADDDERAARRASDHSLADRIERGTTDEFVNEWLSREMFSGLGSRSEEWRHTDRALRMANTPTGLAAALRGYGLGAMPYLGARLSQLAMPVTVVAGADDATSVAMSEDMVESLPNAEMRLVDSGHAVVGERPDEVAALLRAIIDRA